MADVVRLFDEPVATPAGDEWKLELLSRRSREDDPVDDEICDSSALVALLEANGWKCWYCGCDLTPPVGDAIIGTAGTREHLLPRARGGTNKADNVVAACRRCNVSKQAKTVEEYRARLGGSVVFHGERSPPEAA